MSLDKKLIPQVSLKKRLTTAEIEHLLSVTLKIECDSDRKASRTVKLI